MLAVRLSVTRLDVTANLSFLLKTSLFGCLSALSLSVALHSNNAEWLHCGPNMVSRDTAQLLHSVTL